MECAQVEIQGLNVDPDISRPIQVVGGERGGIRTSRNPRRFVAGKLMQLENSVITDAEKRSVVAEQGVVENARAEQDKGAAGVDVLFLARRTRAFREAAFAGGVCDAGATTRMLCVVSSASAGPGADKQNNPAAMAAKNECSRIIIGYRHNLEKSENNKKRF